MKAVILAAGLGSRLAPLTDDRPKALVDVGGRSFLLRQLDRLAEVGITGADVVIVGGYKIEALHAELARTGHACTVVMNDHYADWNNFYSVVVAEPALGGADFLQLDGDVLLDSQVLPRMLAAPGDAVLALDRHAEIDAEAMKIQLGDGERVAAISKKLAPAGSAGEYIGVARIGGAASRAVFAALNQMAADGITNDYYEYAFNQLAGSGAVEFGVVDVHDCTVLEVDDVAGLARAEQLLAQMR